MKKKIFTQDYYKNFPGYPSKERLAKARVVVIECVQDIPCNPCETICPRKAIVVGKPITNLPRLIEENCTGCGRCIPICPGLAVFVVNNNYNDKESTISLPYEFLPLPEKGEEVIALNREGEKVCRAKVISVLDPEKNNRTAVITIAVPKEYSGEVRGIRLIRKNP
ncbi:hypothetical protein AUJ66_06720 [Candidatus Desantisbacteria bacterium CG1_02_38_46]|uniref:4Fe-4S ferredoxin n=3 Tax=unclassified Candidatus Desantisiibacteriota TaxID=3106372 RepID=A0A2H9PBU1_9BACT|nr:MAG: hypothetical protein AUJ66_06720 [Candidatus Desantisbacteria bacterium CG1_02_38_46]PIU50723.1 MAG: 4Fe-4S ferredoxin [Candidatus Desantisbacteria bacterium CG07_land_8_20_14_0_80_39_15]PIZ16419.1 MAG: 4Fe-4S ferredoxin [Candidatus Desantisbacteria bacterium CG_4_10_14_0_8_um_filter_39_17]